MNPFVQLLIDAGATKTEFVILQDRDVVHQFRTAGINANYATNEQINVIFEEFIASYHFPEKDFDKICYYGAGCANEQNALRIGTFIARFFPNSSFRIYSDLMEACHALCGHNPGLVAILGTGSSSCLYDGDNIIQRAPSLGYLIGDEGSGTHLGKMLITQYMMQKLPQNICQDIERTFDLNPDKVIENIYRKDAPNKFFASFAPYIQENIEENTIKQLCKDSFSDFFDKQIGYYNKKTYDSVSFIGSIAFHFKEIITEVAKEKDISIGNIIASPMEKLIEYHTENLNN